MLTSTTGLRAVVLGLLASMMLMAGCSAENYDDPDGPRYAGQYIDPDSNQASDPREGLKVVTFNIEFAKKVKAATKQIATHPRLKDADVILVQEMTSASAEYMAKELRMDYVYYPASVHKSGEFGQAVLSRYPIVDDEKVMLPHRNPMSGRLRIAVAAVLDTPAGLVGALSVHSDTPWLGPEGRKDQWKAIRNYANHMGIPVFFGGDFNTSDPGSVEGVASLFLDAGYAWASRGVGATGGYAGKVFLQEDHVFTRGFEPTGARAERTEASDHRPVWVTLDLIENAEDAEVT